MPPPIIRCDPPDPAFVNQVARAYDEACATLTDEMAVLVGTLVRVRAEYPRALIVPTDDARIDGQPSVTWIAFRDGWFPAMRHSPRGNQNTRGSQDSHEAGAVREAGGSV
jgi:hypothetical protein